MAAGLTILTLLSGIAVAGAQTTGTGQNMGIRKGTGMGYPLSPPHVSTVPRIKAFIVRPHARVHWGTFQTRSH